MKRMFVLWIAAVLLLSGCASVLPDETKTVEIYKEATVRSALLAEEPTAEEQKLLKAVSKPTSLGITLPNVDPQKIVPAESPLLSTLPQYETFRTELLAHRKTEEEIAVMTYAEYSAWYRTWLLSEGQIQEIKEHSSALKDRDLSGWTNGDWEDYQMELSYKNMLKKCSEEQLAELQQRNVQKEDLFALFKEYHQVESILAQTDETLKAYLESVYATNLDFSLGEGTADAIREKNS